MNENFSVDLNKLPVAQEGSGDSYGFRVSVCPRCHSFQRRQLNDACQSKPYQPIHFKQWHPWHDEVTS